MSESRRSNRISLLNQILKTLRNVTGYPCLIPTSTNGVKNDHCLMLVHNVWLVLDITQRSFKDRYVEGYPQDIWDVHGMSFLRGPRDYGYPLDILEIL